MQTGDILAYVGTWSQSADEGINRYKFSSTTGELEFLGKTVTKDPFHLTISQDRRFLYSTNSADEGANSGKVSAFAIDPDSGDLTLLNQQPSEGVMPCYVCVNADNSLLLVGNYNSGTVAVLPIEEDGSLGAPSDLVQHEGTGPAPRQTEPHVHSFLFDPTDRFGLSADLGADRIFVYDLQGGSLKPNDPPSVQVQAGAGPRHFTFHPNNRFGYLINELDNTINVYDYDAATGKLRETQSITTLPDGYSEDSYTADVQVHPSGKFLYGTNRGHNSIAIFSIDQTNGQLSPLGCESSRGDFPWNIAIDPTANFLLATNTNSGNVPVWRIDQESGGLSPVGATPVTAAKPTVVRLQQF